MKIASFFNTQMSNTEYLANLKNQQMCEPKEFDKFYPSKAQELIKSTLEQNLRGYEFDVASLPLKTDELTKTLRDAVRNWSSQTRYKYVVQVVLGEIKQQGLKITSKCLWDVNSDNYASYTFRTETYYCTALVFACYNE